MRIKEIKKAIENEEEKLRLLIDEETFEKAEKVNTSILRKERKFRNFQRLVFNLLVIFFIIWLLFYVAIGLTSAPNEDMRPAFHGGDLVVYDKLYKHPGIGDVVVYEKANTTYIGRIVAKGGDKVEIMETGGIKINDAAYVENYIYESTYPLTTLEYPVVLAEDEYFILADARGSGEDSRYFGVIKQSEIQGKAAGLFRRSGF